MNERFKSFNKFFVHNKETETITKNKGKFLDLAIFTQARYTLYYDLLRD